MSAIQEYFERELGFELRADESPLTFTVGGAVTQIWRPNPDRLVIYFINPSDTDMYIYIDNQVSATRGFLLSASGGYAVFSVSDLDLITGHSWFAYCTASKDLLTIALDRLK